MSIKDLLKKIKSSPDGDSLAIEIEKYLMRVDRDENKEDDGKFHPSGITGCVRMEMFKKMGLEKNPIAPILRRVFGMGTHVHLRIQDYMKGMGILEGKWECKHCAHIQYAVSCDLKECPECGANLGWTYREVAVEFPEYDIRGHADGIIVLSKRYLVEIKSCRSTVWARLKEPMEKHVRQASIYADGVEIDEIFFLYENKDTQEFKEFRVKVNPKFVQEIKDVIKSAKAGLAAKEMAPGIATDDKDPHCKWCDCKGFCFSGLDFEEYTKMFAEAKK